MEYLNNNSETSDMENMLKMTMTHKHNTTDTQHLSFISCLQKSLIYYVIFVSS